MASGGWLGNIISAPLRLVDNILGGGNDETVSASTTTYPTVTARDLVSSTESAAPQAPVMGSDNSYPSGTNSTRKKRGLASLYIDNKDNSTNNNYTGVGGL